MSKRTIAVVTGTRAEFGLLETVMRAIAAHPKLQLRTVVAGMHLVSGTWRDVRDAGFTIDARVRLQRSGHTGRAADVAGLGRGVAGFGSVFDEMQPDIVLVLGDRIEAMAAATAASVGGFVLAHVHGGDRAEGVADEAMRHAISKLSHLHFPATVQSARRLIRMGEKTDAVFNVGSPAVDGLRSVEPGAETRELIVMQHPIGASDRDEAKWMRQTLKASASVRGKRMVMGPNCDPGCAGIQKAIRTVDTVGHLPRSDFLAALAGARVIVGNSSAGLIEAAVLKTPCVNIGPRQNGREKPPNVVDCDYGEASVARAIHKAMKLDLRRMRHPYGEGHTGRRIADELSHVNLGPDTTRKRNAY